MLKCLVLELFLLPSLQNLLTIRFDGTAWNVLIYVLIRYSWWCLDGLPGPVSVHRHVPSFLFGKLLLASSCLNQLAVIIVPAASITSI